MQEVKKEKKRSKKSKKGGDKNPIFPSEHSTASSSSQSPSKRKKNERRTSPSRQSQMKRIFFDRLSQAQSKLFEKFSTVKPIIFEKFSKVKPILFKKTKKDSKFLLGVILSCLIFLALILASIDLDPYDTNTKIATLDSVKPHIDDITNPPNNQQQQNSRLTINYDPKAHPDQHKRIEYFRDVARDLNPTTDKIGITSEHRYHNMYGMFLLPYAAHKPTMKMLEIGLGCNMAYGAGASVALWKKLFPSAELWEAEYDEQCVTQAKQKGQLQGINVLVGDQASIPTLNGWIRQSGGKFDVIIDDGGHHNCQMYNSFCTLWHELLPGGLYFIEDLHTSKWDAYIGHQCQNKLMRDLLMDYMEQLMFKTTEAKRLVRDGKAKYRLPNDVQFVHCIAEACVIGKRLGPVNDSWQPQKRDGEIKHLRKLYTA